MFNRVMVGSSDIERSKWFYDAVLSTLGMGEPIRNEANSGHVRLFYRHGGNSLCVSDPINGEAATAGNDGTITFKCDSLEQVREFHEIAVMHGGHSSKVLQACGMTINSVQSTRVGDEFGHMVIGDRFWICDHAAGPCLPI